LTALAVAVPFSAAYQLAPQPAFVNQTASLALWLLVIACLAWLPARDRSAQSIAQRLPSTLWMSVLVLIGFGVLIGRSAAFTVTPSLAVLCAALALSHLAKRVSIAWRRGWFLAFCAGVTVAAIYNSVVGLMQIYTPLWFDDVWIASNTDHRAAGNLRQPNQLATLLLWGILSVAALFRSRFTLAIVLIAVFASVLWLTGSRAGLIGFLVVIACVAYSRYAERAESTKPLGKTKIILTIAVLLCVALLVVLGLIYWTQSRENSMSSLVQRLALWRDVLHLIGTEPWLGVGFAQLNFAWTLTPLPQRAPDVFDHAHSLPLQLAVEFGVSAACLILLLIGWVLLANWRNQPRAEQVVSLGCLTTVLLHSLVEYPLWFAYFLLPTAFCLSIYCLSSATNTATESVRPGNQWLARWLPMLGVLLVGSGIAWAINGYLRIANVYEHANRPEAALRLAAVAKRHWLYGYYGDYAAIMLSGLRAEASDFNRPARAIIDERLLGAWARTLAREGKHAEAAYLVARAKEFPATTSFGALPVLEPPRAASAPISAADFRKH
jgi:O-antigen ligase